MEAALRSAYFLITGENPEPDSFKSVRGMKGWKEATFEIKGLQVRVAVASGLGNTRRLMEAIKKEKSSTTLLKLWHVLADAWAEAVSRYMTAVNMPLRGKSSTVWINSPGSDSPTKTRQYR